MFQFMNRMYITVGVLDSPTLALSHVFNARSVFSQLDSCISVVSLLKSVLSSSFDLYQRICDLMKASIDMWPEQVQTLLTRRVENTNDLMLIRRELSEIISRLGDRRAPL